MCRLCCASMVQHQKAEGHQAVPQCTPTRRGARPRATAAGPGVPLRRGGSSPRAWGVKRMQELSWRSSTLGQAADRRACCVVTAHWMASAGSWKASRKESPSVAISYPQNLRTGSGLEPAHGRHASADRLHAVLLRTWTPHCGAPCKRPHPVWYCSRGWAS